ncbi:MAG: DUF1501 domain-containing protein [Isosphaeraceae bacterium]
MLSVTGLSLPSLLQARANEALGKGSGFGRAKSCIVIFMWGGPSQLDTWDPKPDAPIEIRGGFKSIGTKTPGVRISEHFPLLAARTDRLAIIRSMTHDDPAHLSSAHRTLTGHLAPRPFSDADGPSPNDSPHLGALVSRFRRPGQGGLPASVTMPWTVAHPAAPGGRAPGQDAGWLGKAHEPFRIEGDPNAAGFRVEGLTLPPGVDPSRFEVRRELLGRQAASALAGPESVWEGFQSRALGALTSARARSAFDIEKEPPRLRDKYGRHIHGQCLLLARRLVEFGVPLVTVNWHDDHQNFWDTHGENFHHLKNRLMPPADQGFAALLDDLEARGLLDSTLVAWVGEFGRTPRTTNGGTGREHWPRCYSAVLAGGGIVGGQVYGASDRWAAYPARDPVSPDDYAATILHALGIDPHQQLRDGLGRPMPINLGQPITTLFG